MRKARSAFIACRSLRLPEAISEFRVQLDDYDTVTVEALMENQAAIDAVQERIEAMLQDAHILPDGRRVFKTKDGMRVFDEHGQELPPEIIDPMTIDDMKPRWESFSADMNEWERLMQEREQLHDYQAKLDDARERLDSGEITQDELDKLKTVLAEDVPVAVREKLGLEKPQVEIAPAHDATVTAEAALPPDMDALMRQTGFAQGPMMP